MKDIAIIRSMSTKEGDHGRATFNLRTGYLPPGPIRYPTLGSLVAKELGDDDAELPNFVSIAPGPCVQPGRVRPGLPRAAVRAAGRRRARRDRPPGGTDARNLSFKVEDLDLPPGVGRPPGRRPARAARRDRARTSCRATPAIGPREPPGRLPAGRPADAVGGGQGVRPGRGAGRACATPTAGTSFGQGCLLARRLVERGVPFVEVTLSAADGATAVGWDTHQQNFDAVKKLSGVLDPAWATLMDDLAGRGLLDSTLIVWMGEFGRTPKINPQAGRDHFPNAWTTVLAGGGIKGGQVIGSTGADGMEVKDRPVSVPDFLATVCKGLGIDPMAPERFRRRPADPASSTRRPSRSRRCSHERPVLASAGS